MKEKFTARFCVTADLSSDEQDMLRTFLTVSGYPFHDCSCSWCMLHHNRQVSINRVYMYWDAPYLTYIRCSDYVC